MGDDRVAVRMAGRRTLERVDVVVRRDAVRGAARAMARSDIMVAGVIEMKCEGEGEGDEVSL